jgi:hypothetical protein
MEMPVVKRPLETSVAQTPVTERTISIYNPMQDELNKQ